MPENDLPVGIAEFRVARGPLRLTAHGLGSCVAVSLFDRKKRLGGLAHIMLPSSRLHSKVTNPGKYADTAIESLAESLWREGADLDSLEAKLVGGANMFSSLSYQAVPIGARNVSAAREKLMEKGFQIVAKDTGGAQGRTMFFSLEDGRIEIRKLRQPLAWI